VFNTGVWLNRPHDRPDGPTGPNAAEQLASLKQQADEMAPARPIDAPLSPDAQARLELFRKDLEAQAVVDWKFARQIISGR